MFKWFSLSLIYIPGLKNFELEGGEVNVGWVTSWPLSNFRTLMDNEMKEEFDEINKEIDQWTKGRVWHWQDDQSEYVQMTSDIMTKWTIKESITKWPR